MKYKWTVTRTIRETHSVDTPSLDEAKKLATQSLQEDNVNTVGRAFRKDGGNVCLEVLQSDVCPA